MKEVTRVVIEMKTEVIAAGIRTQIDSLKYVIQEIEHGPLGHAALAWRLKAVEQNLRRLRDAA